MVTDKSACPISEKNYKTKVIDQVDHKALSEVSIHLPRKHDNIQPILACEE